LVCKARGAARRALATLSRIIRAIPVHTWRIGKKRFWLNLLRAGAALSSWEIPEHERAHSGARTGLVVLMWCNKNVMGRIRLAKAFAPPVFGGVATLRLQQVDYASGYDREISRACTHLAVSFL